MKFWVTRTSKGSYGKPQIQGAVKEGLFWVLEVGTIEELLALSAKLKCELVVGVNAMQRDGPYLEIYDDYRE